MKDTYVIWKVYECENDNPRFFIVDQNTKKIQSAWNNEEEARHITKGLNDFVKKMDGETA